MPIAAKVALLIVLGLMVGAGVAFAPVLAFTAVAATLGTLIWYVNRVSRVSSAKIGRIGQPRRKKARSTLTTKLVSTFLLLWWLALIAPLLAFTPRDISDAAQTSVGGSLLNQLLFISFGFVGFLFLPRAIRRFDPAFRWIVGLWTLHLGWTFLSLFWSVYPPITLRNAVAFVLVSVGSFGLGAGFYGAHPQGRDLFLRHVFAAGILSALIILLPLPFRWGEYDLLDPSQRLAIGGGFPYLVVRPVICALLVLAATAVLRVRDWRSHDWVWVAILLSPLLVLKSRGPILYALLAFGIFYLLYKARIRDRILQGAALLVTGLGAFVYFSTGVLEVLVSYLTRGDVEATMDLTGRIPLWEIVIPEIKENPIVGVGFAAFWNPESLASMELRVGFPVVSAHSGFFDMMLGTGVVGLAILMVFCLYAIALVVRRARRGDTLGWLVFVFLVFYLLSNLTVSIFTEFLEIPLILILAMLGLMASGPPGARPQSGPEASAKTRLTEHVGASQ